MTIWLAASLLPERSLVSTASNKYVPPPHHKALIYVLGIRVKKSRLIPEPGSSVDLHVCENTLYWTAGAASDILITVKTEQLRSHLGSIHSACCLEM